MEPELHPTLAALLPRLELVQDCWHLLAESDGTDRREHYLPRGEREPQSAYRRRLEAALLSGFFRDALRTFAGMLASSHWRELPASLQAVITDVDGCGTDLGVFLEAADLLLLRNGAALVGVIPAVHLWPSEGDRQQALRNGDRLSLPRLLLLERGDVLHWLLPGNYALPDVITWRQPLAKPPNLHPWQYLTASLVADGSMTLTIETLVADPQAPAGVAAATIGSARLPRHQGATCHLVRQPWLCFWRRGTTAPRPGGPIPQSLPLPKRLPGIAVPNGTTDGCAYRRRWSHGDWC